MTRPIATGVLTIFLVTICGFANDAFAWGPEGHRIVCRIAFVLLDKPQQGEVTRLSKLYKTPDGAKFKDFPEACLFPDEARTKARDHIEKWERFADFSEWHFLNVPRSTHEVSEDHCGGNCVLTGISHHSARLREAPTDQERAEALAFLGHWIGDVHQPLHVSYSDDQGGNQIKPIKGGFYQVKSFHQLWDSGAIGKAIEVDGWKFYANRLAARISLEEKTDWIGVSPLRWAQESYLITTTDTVQYCDWNADSCLSKQEHGRTLGSPYQKRFRREIDNRLQKAGVRLAQEIRRNLQIQ